MKKLIANIKNLLKRAAGQRGIGLVETLVAVAILGTAVAAFVVSLSAGTIGVNEQDTETAAQRLAQNQLEYTKNYAYIPGAATYPSMAAPSGYTVDVSVGAVSGTDANMQKITVNVLRDGTSVFVLSGYKVNR